MERLEKPMPRFTYEHWIVYGALKKKRLYHVFVCVYYIKKLDIWKKKATLQRNPVSLSLSGLHLMNTASMGKAHTVKIWERLVLGKCPVESYELCFPFLNKLFLTILCPGDTRALILHQEAGSQLRLQCYLPARGHASHHDDDELNLCAHYTISECLHTRRQNFDWVKIIKVKSLGWDLTPLLLSWSKEGLGQRHAWRKTVQSNTVIKQPGIGQRGEPGMASFLGEPTLPQPWLYLDLGPGNDEFLLIKST